MPHTDLLFDTVTLAMTFSNGVSANWSAKKHPSPNSRDPVQYEVTITSPGGTYSLLTLGVQGIGHDVFITNITSASGVGFIEPGTTTPKPKPPKDLMIRRTGVIADEANPALESVDATQIWFIVLPNNSPATLTIEQGNRRRFGETHWKAGHFGSGHDNTPPGGDSGE